MSFGFGKVAPGEWDKVKQGSREDTVPPGDYFARLVRVFHFEAEKSKKGIGTYNLEFMLTDGNEASVRGKRIVCRCNYHPAPQTVPDKDFATMNNISLTAMAQLIEAANATPELDGNGQFDVVLTVEKLAKAEPTVVVSVTHRNVDGRSFQDIGNFKAVTR